MKRFGLIGHPISHSFSPSLFKAGYDGRYPYELIETDDFEEAYKRFIEGYDGINVTAPFKELAYAKADMVSEECLLAKAANLLIKTSEGVKAFNSDLLGVRLWLQEILLLLSGDMPVGEKRATPLAAGGGAHEVGGVLFETGISPDRSEQDIRPIVLIAGCGGAGKAAAAAAATLGMRVILMNRNHDRADALADYLNEIGHIAEVRKIEDFPISFQEADIIIYNIPAAIPELNKLTDKDFAPGKHKFIMEANYKDPSFDKSLITRMKTANPLAEYTGGKTWLLYQALTGYEIFTGETPDLAGMSAVL